MILDTAKRSDIPALQQLFERCFGDPKTYTDLYFKFCFQPERVYVLRHTGGIRAMTIAFPTLYIAEDGDEQAGAYFYAVATDPDYRGRGFCRALLQYAEQSLRSRGMDFACLKPGSTDLTQLYEKLGYNSSFSVHEVTVRAGEILGLSIHLIDEKRYFNLRQLLLQDCFLVWQQEALAHQRRLCERQGGALLELFTDSGIGCAACEFDGKKLIIKEFLGEEGWLPGICSYFHTDIALARLPGKGTLFAMAKTLSGKPLPGGWLGFAFD